MPYLYLSLAILTEVIGTSTLKASEGFTRLVPTVISLASYCATLYFMSLTLKTIPTGVVYAIWSGIGIVLISIVAWFWYGQSLDGPALCGIGLILAGVMVINLFSKSMSH